MDFVSQGYCEESNPDNGNRARVATAQSWSRLAVLYYNTILARSQQQTETMSEFFGRW